MHVGNLRAGRTEEAWIEETYSVKTTLMENHSEKFQSMKFLFCSKVPLSLWATRVSDFLFFSEYLGFLNKIILVSSFWLKVIFSFYLEISFVWNCKTVELKSNFDIEHWNFRLWVKRQLTQVYLKHSIFIKISHWVFSLTELCSKLHRSKICRSGQPRNFFWPIRNLVNPAVLNVTFSPKKYKILKKHMHHDFFDCRNFFYFEYFKTHLRLLGEIVILL